MTLSPRLPEALACDVACAGPTGAESSRMTGLASGRGARSVVIGRGRSAAAATAVTAFARSWEAGGGTVLDVVTWPEEAASWLRQAARFTAVDPDLWVMAGPPRGWAQMTRRLLWSTPWQPGRTLAFAALGTQHAIGLVGACNLQGLAGATADGGTWTVRDGNLQVAPGLSRLATELVDAVTARMWSEQHPLTSSARLEGASATPRTPSARQTRPTGWRRRRPARAARRASRFPRPARGP
jgi:hypothetical protein